MSRKLQFFRSANFVIYQISQFYKIKIEFRKRTAWIWKTGSDRKYFRRLKNSVIEIGNVAWIVFQASLFIFYGK